jgi:hypothetical protein
VFLAGFCSEGHPGVAGPKLYYDFDEDNQHVQKIIAHFPEMLINVLAFTRLFELSYSAYEYQTS